MKIITITQDENSTMKKEDLIALCTPDWTKQYNPNGQIRVDSVVDIMSLCAGLLLEHLEERLRTPLPATEQEYLEEEKTKRFDGGGDDTAADYIPCALENIVRIAQMHMSLAFEGDKKDLEDKKQFNFEGDEIMLMDDDQLDENQIKIYREYTTMAGASWDEYDDLNND